MEVRQGKSGLQNKMERRNIHHNKDIFEVWLWKAYSNDSAKGKMACKDLFVLETGPI